jgi:hypothetical protein
MEKLSANAYTVEQADLVRDRELILDLWSRNLRSHTPAEHRARFDWHYLRNPTHGACCFLAHHKATGRVIGTAGLGIRHLHTAGLENTAGIGIDFAVEPDHRTLQPAMFLARAVANSIGSGVDFIYALPNANARAVFRRIGYVQVAPFRRFVKVLDATRFLQRRGVPDGVAVVAGGSLNFVQRVLDRVRRDSRNDCRAHEISWSDSRIDLLWDSARQRHQALGDRRSVHLKWRFRDCPLHQHVLIGFTRQTSDELLGYAVVYIADHGQVKVPDLLLVSETWAANVWTALSDWADERASSSIAFEIVRPSDRLLGALRQTGFHEREPWDILHVLDKRSGSPARTAPWYFLRADEFYNTF